MNRIVLACLVGLPLSACSSLNPFSSVTRPESAVGVARDVCEAAWSKPAPDESHWGAVLNGDTWHVWLKDKGGTARCAVAMVAVDRNSGAADGCVPCPSF